MNTDSTDAAGAAQRTLEGMQDISHACLTSCTAYLDAWEAVIAIMSSFPSSSASATAWMYDLSSVTCSDSRQPLLTLWGDLGLPAL